MVLHQNKWDHKATRAHVRKLKAKGKEDDTKKPKGQGSGDPKRTGEQAKESPTESSDDYDGDELEHEDGNDESAVHRKKKEASEENSKDGSKSEEKGDQGEEENGEARGIFSRRKVQSNSWRYEEDDEEEEFYVKATAGNHEEDQDPEPDYVSMTIGRKGQLKDMGAVNKEKFDETFLKEKSELFVSRRGGGDQAQLSSKGKVVKVDRREFEDVTQKIAKQSTADAFRQRFAPKKAKSRVVPGGAGPSEDGQNVDDIDAFLGELNMGDLPSPRTHMEEGRRAGSREIRSGLGRSSTSDERKHDKDSEWLDSMLNAR